jgi:peptide/nickel transport system permease protein
MAENNSMLPTQSNELLITHRTTPNASLRFGRYILIRLLVLVFTVTASVYVTIIAANLGGKVDEIMRNRIRELMFASGQTYESWAAFEEARAEMEAAAGLDQPLLLRSVHMLTPVMTLDLGQTEPIRVALTTRLSALRSFGADRFDVKLIILERIPATLLLLGVSNLFIFLTSIVLALNLVHRRGGLLDKIIVSLAPISSIPAWFYAIFLVYIFAGILGLFPHGGMLPSPPPESRFLYALGVVRHMILPFSSIFLGAFFYSVYLWRNYFLIYADEDFVDMAWAKGLPSKVISKRYILRPALPPILTNFALVMLSTLAGSLVLEIIFNWPGLGQLFMQALITLNHSVIIGLTVVYAYLLGFTLLILDLAYALLDPRIRIGIPEKDTQEGRFLSTAQTKRWRTWLQRGRFRSQSDVRNHVPVKKRVNLLFITARQLPGQLFTLLKSTRSISRTLRELIRYPSAVVGLVILIALAGSILYTINAIPYDIAVQHWRGSPDSLDLPRNARPAWFNLFSNIKLPETIVLDSRDGSIDKIVSETSDFREIMMVYTFDYNYDKFPQDLAIYLYPQFDERAPHVELTWITPDDREIRMIEFAPRSGETYNPSQDSRLIRRLGRIDPKQGLFRPQDEVASAPLQGTYQLQINALFFEEGGDIDARFVLTGELHGLAGTDHRRRDLSVALFWGTPTVLVFGILGAVFTVVGTLLIAGFGVWFGGITDWVIQRITEINLAIPVFPILALIASFYTLSIWYILALAVLLSIFSSSIKTYRAIFLQVKTSPYIEAAQAYGAGNLRMVFVYLIPRIMPVLLPQMVTLVPVYVFLEAALAFIGQSDPVLPTWGKIIHDAHVNSALLQGNFYWILTPAFLLLLVGFAFSMIGHGLERILNPRLRHD